MKKALHLFKGSLLIAMMGIMLQGCLKDTSTRTYTMFTPVYKTTAEVRANIKNNPAQGVHNPGKIFLYGNYIFLNEVDKGVHIIDNSNPSAPVNKYFINIPGNLDIAVKDNILYADLYSDMVAIDITDPASISVKKVIDDAFPFRRYANGFLGDTSRIIVEWIKKDTTVEASSRWNVPTDYLYDMASSFNGANSSAVTKGISGSMARFTLLNDYLYTVTDNSLNVFDVSQPHDPLFKNKINLAWNIETIYPFKSNLFIGSTTGMFIFGTTNPAAPNALSSFSHIRSCDPVIADDDYAYVTLRSGTTCQGFSNQLDILNIQNLSSPTLVKTTQLTNPHGLSKDGNLLFICDGPAGLKVFNAADVSNLKLLQTVDGLETFDIITNNKVAIVVAKDGLYQYNYSNASNLQFLSKISIINN
jgi:hypothetical protein